MTMLLELVGVVLLILLNAFFVAGEYALVTVRRTRMKELADEGSRTARTLSSRMSVRTRLPALISSAVRSAVGALRMVLLDAMRGPCHRRRPPIAGRR